MAEAENAPNSNESPLHDLENTDVKGYRMETSDSVSIHQKIYDKEIAETLLNISPSDSTGGLEDISRDRTQPTRSNSLTGHSLTVANLQGHNANDTSTTGNKMRVGPQHFMILKLIGEGAFGKVMLVKNQLNDGIYAMKVISKKLLKKKNHISYMKSERAILTKAKHPFVVALRFAFQSEKRLFLVMDYLSGGELFFHLRKRGTVHTYSYHVYKLTHTPIYLSILMHVHM